MYPFGYGLGYTNFVFSDLLVEREDSGFRVSVDVRNEGEMKGTEKVQVYASFTDSRTATPRYQLCGLCPVELVPGEKKRICIDVNEYWICAVLSDGSRVKPDGEVMLYVGSHQPDPRSAYLTKTECLVYPNP